MRLRQVISLTCLAAVILFGGYLMLPQSAQYIVTPAVAAAAGGVALWRASRRNDETAAWWLMGIGLLQATCGEALWGLYDSVWNIDPFPSMADVFYLAYYPLVALALERLLRHRTGRDSGAVLDATVAALGIGVLLWQFVVAPQLSQTSMGSLEIVISVAYPAADILLLGLVLRLAFARHAMGWTGVLLASGIAMMFLADVTWMLLELTGSYAVGNVIDLAYLASYAMLGAAAAMNPSHAESGASKEVLPTGRLVLLVTTSLSAPAVLIWQGATSADIDTLWVGVVSGVLFVLVLLRMHGLVRRVEKQAWQLEQLSLTDALTALPNRRSWDLVTPRTFALASRTGERVCVAMLDLDHFKRFNDEHGHQAGDEMLRATADAWREVLREGDVLVRYGGEEFAVLLPGCGADEATEVVDRIREAVPAGETCSAGVAERLPHEQAEQTLHRADRALYAAKSLGRDRTVVDQETREPGDLVPAGPVSVGAADAQSVA